MPHGIIKRRTPFTCDARTLADPAEGLRLARMLLSRGKRNEALDIYDQLAQAHAEHAVVILAEAYDVLKSIEPRTRHTLYQSRFFDFGIAPGDTVLDMGSGHMPFPHATHLADISFSDHSIGRNGAAFTNVNGLPCWEVSVEKTDFADKQFDFVYCSHVLEHPDDPAAACRELIRIGKRGYIETPTQGKDAFLGSARASNHRWSVQQRGGKLIFSEYEERDLEGFGCNILMDMHVAPKTDREKAFSTLIYLRADQCNVMFAWNETFEFEVHRSTVQSQCPADISQPHIDGGNTVAEVDERPVAKGKKSLKLLQVHSFYTMYLDQFYGKYPELSGADYATQMQALHLDGFSGIHMLARHLGPLGYDADLIVGNNLRAQYAWAFEQGLQSRSGHMPGLDEILVAQVEAFDPDVLYLSDPTGYDSNFVRKLSKRPQLVLGWRAANIPQGWDPTEFDVILSCLSGIRRKAKEMGAKDAVHFHPGFPEYLHEEVKNEPLTHDVCFTGQVNTSQYPRRVAMLHKLTEACLQGRFKMNLRLFGPPEAMTPLTRTLNTGPVFGLDMYRTLASGRIAVDVRGNIGIRQSDGSIEDLAGSETANMRIFETTGVGAFLLTEYFDNVGDFFEPGKEIETYRDEKELLEKIDYYLAHEDERKAVAQAGYERCRRDHSMAACIKKFDAIVRNKLPKRQEKTMQTMNTSTSHTGPVAGIVNDADMLAEKLKRLAKLGADAAGDVSPLLDMALVRLDGLLQSGDYERALALASAAKCFAVPVRGLDVRRALAFHGLGQPSAAKESLKEELRYFPDNGEAAELLKSFAGIGAGDVPHDANPEFQELLSRIRPFTMLSVPRLHSLYSLARKACSEELQGNFVECGVAAGGSSALLSAVIKRHAGNDRRLYAFDTFEGMPAPTEHDTHQGQAADDTGWGQGTCASPVETVRAAAQAVDAEDALVPVKGLFCDTLPEKSSEIGPIALLHMDSDWYESTMDILEHLYDQVVPGGYIQIDDFGHWQGCRQAVEEFAEKRNLHLEVTGIDYSGVWLRKPAV